MAKERLIEATLSTTATSTPPVSGQAITMRHPMSNGLTVTAGCFQVVRVAATGDYEVVLQGGIMKADDTITWSTVATVTQAEDGNLTTFTVAPGAHYRFTHNSGVDATVLLS